MNKPFSQACENNKAPILQVLMKVMGNIRNVLEIGSGTGQHACFFAQELPHLIWQPSDKQENLSGIGLWVNEAKLPNLNKPLQIDVADNPWPVNKVDAVFTANTLHIMSWQDVEIFLSRLPEYLRKGGLLCIYGPFNYGGSYTSESNAQFDLWLNQSNEMSAIRDFEAVEVLANKARIQLLEDIAMPANNRLLLWRQN